MNVSKDDAGLYSCAADNGIGLPAIVDTNLQVLCKFFFTKIQIFFGNPIPFI